MSINQVFMVGHVGKTPEIQFLSSGSSVIQFPMALNRPARDGQPQPPTWVDVKAWNKQAQFAADYVKKGAKIAIVGRLEVEEWTDRQTQEKRRRTVVVADRIELCDRKPDYAERPASEAADVPF